MLSSREIPAPRGGVVRRVGWWLLLGVCVFYGGYAVYMGFDTVLSLLGLAAGATHRRSPIAFIVHSLAGGVALGVGPLQFSRALRLKRRRLHRVLGRIYIGSVWLASAAGLWVSVTLDSSVGASLGFAALAVVWFTTTAIALRRILTGQQRSHREWMTRSFALSLFFVTFSIWVPGAAGLRADASYAIGVWATWLTNLAAAQAWIWRTRSTPAITD